MKPPIFVNDDGDFLIFESVELAERYLEPWESDLFTAYDCEGHFLCLVPFRSLVRIQLAETEPSHIDELRHILINFFAQVGIDKGWLESASMRELIHKSLEYKI